MRKRLLSLLLAVVLVLGMLPKVTLTAEASSNYELKTLTFEDADYKGGTNYAGGNNWSSMIDASQYGGSLLYPSEASEAYNWYDEGNTYLEHAFADEWGDHLFWGGGHAISHYNASDFATYGTNENQLTVYNAAASGMATAGGGHNGSDNFAIHFGYVDDSGYSGTIQQSLTFGDGVARVIDHMYVNNTTYALNCYAKGNELTTNIRDTDWVKLIATGHHADGTTATAELYLVNGPGKVVKDWTKWDLSGLGAVTKVEFNVTGTNDNNYGFSQPGYFAYDDVAVRFEKEEEIPVNNAPALAGDATATATVTVGTAYEMNLDSVFTDVDKDILSYTVSVNDGEAVATESSYSYTPAVAGETKLVFVANDGKASSPAYTVTLTATAAPNTAPYIQLEEKSVSIIVDIGETYTIDLQDVFADDEGDSLTYYVSEDAGATFTSYDSTSEYSHTFESESTLRLAFKVNDGEFDSEIYNATVTAAAPANKKVTVPSDANFMMYFQSPYFVQEELTPISVVDNGDGTKTYSYNHATSELNGVGYSYRMTDPTGQRITQAGYVHRTGESHVTLKWDNTSPGYRGAYDKTTTMGQRGDDSMLVNVNPQGHLVLNGDDSFRLRSFRIWEIIDTDTTNVMIEPDFHYDYDENVITLTSAYRNSSVAGKVSGNAGDNWMDITVAGSGTTFLEVSYDALYIASGSGLQDGDGGSYAQGKMYWNAIDPDRKALVVVQTDGNAASDVSFGIRCMSSNVSGDYYDASGAVAWDAEFDTVYFTEDKGQITLKPTATSGINSVAVSSDKGSTWTTLTADENGVYTAEIEAGSNVIRVINGSGQTAYQVVKGDRLTVTTENITSPGNEFLPGDTVRIHFDGLHFPVGKMSGIYNPGFGNGVRAAGTFAGESVRQNDYYQYNFLSNSWLDVTIPADAAFGSQHKLTDGYLWFNVMGGSPGLHRGLTDTGASVNMGAGSNKFTRSLLPEVTLQVKEVVNTKPVLSEGAPASRSTKTGVALTVDLTGIFTDSREDTLTFSVSTDSGENWTTLESSGYSFSSDTAGEYILKFKAADNGGLESDVYTLTVTVEANAAVWDGKTKTEPKTDEDGAYLISNGAELAWFAAQINAETGDGATGFSGKTVKLTDDIYLGSHPWLIISNNGNSGEPFRGTFDGQYHTIYGMKVDDSCKAGTTTGSLGLFGYVSGATIQNVSVEGTVESAGGNVAGIAARGSGTFINCLSNVTVTSSSTSTGGFGGILGSAAKSSTFTGCANLGDITGCHKNVGGILGASSYVCTFTDCYNRGDITGKVRTSGQNVGGISGSGKKDELINCYSTGNVTASGKNAGKLVSATATDTNCYVSSDSTVTALSNIVTAGTAVPAATLKGYASNLGENWAADTTNINAGFPILTWQAPAEEPANQAPQKSGQDITINLKLNQWHQVDMTQYFSDPEGDKLTYWVSHNSGEAVSFEKTTYMYYPAGSGTQTAAFYATDESGNTSETLNLTATVQAPPREVTVTFSVSSDKDDWYQALDGTTLVSREITVPYFDLSLYGLQRYYYNPQCYSTHSPEDTEDSNNQLVGTAQTADGVVTVMHAFIYATEIYQLKYDEEQAGTGESYRSGQFQNQLSWTGGVGSSFMSFWDHGTNNNYYVDWTYPLGAPEWGSTSDQIALYGGEEISIHLLKNTSASGSNFAFFTANDTNDTFDGNEQTVEVAANWGDTVELKLYQTKQAGKFAATNYEPYAEQDLQWALAGRKLNWSNFDLFAEYYSGDMATDENGKITIDTSYLLPGAYYVMAKGNNAADGSTQTGNAAIKLVIDGDDPVITLSETNKTLTVGESFELTAAVTPADAGVRWGYPATGLTVTQENGKLTVKADAAGTYEIWAYVGNTSYVDENNPYWGIAQNSAKCTITVENAASEEPEIIYGDANGDKSVNLADAQAVFQFFSGTVSFTDAQKTAADVNGSGTADLADAQLIFQYFAGSVDKFPVEGN